MREVSSLHCKLKRQRTANHVDFDKRTQINAIQPAAPLAFEDLNCRILVGPAGRRSRVLVPQSGKVRLTTRCRRQATTVVLFNLREPRYCRPRLSGSVRLLKIEERTLTIRTFARKPKTTQSTTSTKSTTFGWPHFRQGPNTILNLQRTTGNQATHRLLPDDHGTNSWWGSCSPAVIAWAFGWPWVSRPSPASGCLPPGGPWIII